MNGRKNPTQYKLAKNTWMQYRENYGGDSKGHSPDSNCTEECKIWGGECEYGTNPGACGNFSNNRCGVPPKNCAPPWPCVKGGDSCRKNTNCCAGYQCDEQGDEPRCGKSEGTCVGGGKYFDCSQFTTPQACTINTCTWSPTSTRWLKNTATRTKRRAPANPSTRT
jgi:hypothetical protein